MCKKATMEERKTLTLKNDMLYFALKNKNNANK